MYTFKLQAVLDHRQFLEDNLNKALAELRQEALSAQNILTELEHKSMQTAAALEKDQLNGLSSDHVIAYHTYLKRLAERIVAQKTAIMQIDQRIAAKQDEVLEAMKKRQILEKLKEQGLHRHNQAMLRKETNFIDEIAVNQYARKALSAHGEEK